MVIDNSITNGVELSFSDIHTHIKVKIMPHSKISKIKCVSN